MLYLLDEIKTFQRGLCSYFLENRTVPPVINKCIKMFKRQALQRPGREKTQLNSLYMIYYYTIHYYFYQQH